MRDLDVVLSYSGGISEYEFFKILNGYEISISGIPLDINPISVEKTDLVQTGEKNSVQKGLSMETEAIESVDSSAKHTLAVEQVAVENQVESRITFYVTECMEFSMLGEFYEDIATIQEALVLYEQILAKRISGIKGIEFILYDGSIYDGMEYELMLVDKVSWDMVNETEDYSDFYSNRREVKGTDRQAGGTWGHPPCGDTKEQFGML